ncbi:helix-turn-helix domain-containing protein [Streptomyces sp. NPDC090994]|uniref:helix-turn-helix domain-containing protein n=1 Tax=Streptomyces sp. NPDC090994 TaxID=3365969 RepID=UPI00380D93BE
MGNSPGNSPEDERPFEDVSDDVPEEARPSIGHVLRQARIAAGLTVDDISSATRVRIAIVHAIEADDFAPCGGDVYARGHIRTLARAVDLDPAPLLEQFAAERGGRPAPTPAAPLFEAERIRPERRGPNWTAAMVAAIVAVIGFVGFTMVKGGGDDGASEANVAEGAEPTAGKTASASAEPEKPAAPEPTDSAIAAVPQDKVTVQVSATDGRSWISAKDHNGRSLFDGTLDQGESKTFQDNEKVDLVLGDAGAIQLHVNGKEIEDDFQPGAVERLTYTKGDPQAG